MRVEIVNERLLPRFGVDRLLLLLAQDLAAHGHDIGFSALRSDERMLAGKGDLNIIPMPQGLDMMRTEEHAAQMMRARLKQRRPDAVVSGGWPFFRTAREAGRMGAAGLFIDAGAVAQNGLHEPAISMQRELRRLRQIELPGIDRIMPISRFIRDQQTIPDRGHARGVRTVLLGGDHMSADLFPAGMQDGSGAALVARLDALRRAGFPLLLGLGRFEGAGYKHSPALYEILRAVQRPFPNARLLILDAGEGCGIPGDLAGSVIPLGQPDDATLGAIMRLCAVGISPSLWEGFNLPVVEMQHLGRPAVAFNLGAHPEVIAHPWLLCDNQREMEDKIVRLLGGFAPAQVLEAVVSSRERHRWADTLAAWREEIEDAAASRRARPAVKPVRTLLVDVSNASLDPANSGVMRVTRTLCAHLQDQPGLRLLFARWDHVARDYRVLTPEQQAALASYGGPADRMSALHGVDQRLASLGAAGEAAGLFIPEVALDGGCRERIAWARGRGMPVGAIIYDLIPVDHPAFCDPAVVGAFPTYLDALFEADAVWAISAYTLDRFVDYAKAHGRRTPPMLRAVWLPGQFSGQPRARRSARPPSNEVAVLCVSTLEPRKNHRSLLAGWEALRTRRPDVPVRLTLVGNRYAGAPQVAAAVMQATERDDRIEWKAVLDDAALTAEMRACSFTVYSSLVEGFGLPILESLWMGKPCIVHDGGVMAELARDGGCLTVDMRDPDAISQAIERLATDPDLLDRLSAEACARPIARWSDYGFTLGRDLEAMSPRADAGAP